MKLIITESQLKRTINELFSQKLVQNLVDKFQQENPDLDDKIINFYINRFQELKDSPKIQEKDITKYTWEALIKTVDPNQPQDIDIKFDNSGLIYDENNLKIYLANSKKSCVKYGTGYNFCISARGEDDAYGGYRLGGGGTIYFVEDLDRSKERKDGKFVDPKHLLVVMVYDDPNQPYKVTDANNEPNIVADIRSWEPMTLINPKLKNLQHLFVVSKANPQEFFEYELRRKYVSKIRSYGDHLEKSMGSFFDDLLKINDVGPFSVKYVHNLLNDIPVYMVIANPENLFHNTYDLPSVDIRFNPDPNLRSERIKPNGNYMDYLQKVQGWINEYLHEKNKMNVPGFEPPKTWSGTGRWEISRHRAHLV